MYEFGENVSCENLAIMYELGCYIDDVACSCEFVGQEKFSRKQRCGGRAE